MQILIMGLGSGPRFRLPSEFPGDPGGPRALLGAGRVRDDLRFLLARWGVLVGHTGTKETWAQGPPAQ